MLRANSLHSHEPSQTEAFILKTAKMRIVFHWTSAHKKETLLTEQTNQMKSHSFRSNI